MKVIRVVRKRGRQSLHLPHYIIRYLRFPLLMPLTCNDGIELSRELKIQDGKLSVRNIKNSSRRSKRENRKLKVTGAYKGASIQE